jgi:hypothetical protein
MTEADIEVDAFGIITTQTRLTLAMRTPEGMFCMLALSRELAGQLASEIISVLRAPGESRARGQFEIQLAIPPVRSLGAGQDAAGPRPGRRAVNRPTVPARG